jgi:hypothetical protein
VRSRGEQPALGHRQAICCGGCERRTRRERVRYQVYRRWLHEGSVHRWHGLATILTLMAARCARHRSAALHCLLRRRNRTAVQRIRSQSDNQRHHYNRLENFSHQPNVLAPRVAVNLVMSRLTPALSLTTPTFTRDFFLIS